MATAIVIVEVRAGLRPPHQLDRLSHYSLWPIWPRLAEHPQECPVPIVPRPLAVTVRELSPGLVDATVVIGFGGRTHALGLRLDGAPGFWQVVELDYPAERMAARPPLDEPLPALPGRQSDPPFHGDREAAEHWRASADASRRPQRGDPHPQRDLGESLEIELE